MFDQNFCVHCTSEAEAMQLLSILESKGYLWSSGRNPTSHTNWDDPKNTNGIWYNMRKYADTFYYNKFGQESRAASPAFFPSRA